MKVFLEKRITTCGDVSSSIRRDLTESAFYQFLSLFMMEYVMAELQPQHGRRHRHLANLVSSKQQKRLLGVVDWKV